MEHAFAQADVIKHTLMDKSQETSSEVANLQQRRTEDEPVLQRNFALDRFLCYRISLEDAASLRLYVS